MNDRKHNRIKPGFKVNLGKARRRVQMRSALLLTLGVCFFMGVYRMLASLDGMAVLWDSQLTGVLAEMLMAVLIFGGALYLGLFVLDGDQRRILPRSVLSGAQVLWLALAGVLMTAPVTLGENVFFALFASGERVGAFYIAAPGAFTLRLVKSALIVPVLEELFFRGYLLGALERYGKVRAALITALCFAAVHMGGKGAAPLDWLLFAAMGLMFAAVCLRTGSLIASMLMHGCYNAALLFFACAGLNDLFARLTFVSGAVRLGMCFGFVYCLRRAWTARGTRAQLQPMQRLTRKEAALTAAAVAAVLAAVAIEAILGVQG